MNLRFGGLRRPDFFTINPGYGTGPTSRVDWVELSTEDSRGEPAAFGRRCWGLRTLARPDDLVSRADIGDHRP